MIDIFVDEEKENNFVLVIKDNGTGLPKEFNTDTSMGGGKGLGWHIINTLVKEDLNGKIYINEPGHLLNGRGTTVKIEARLSENRTR